MNEPSVWQLNPLFEDVKNPDELRAWLMRAYFNPTKHSRERYYRPDITRENVLEFISVSKSKFPQTPLAIVEVWSVLPSLREGLKSVVADDDDTKENTAVYFKGEKTLASIGQAIGGVTPTMVNKISDTAILKMTTMIKALSGEDERLAKMIDEKINQSILDAAEKLADGILQSDSIDSLLSYLMQLPEFGNQEIVLDEIEKDCFVDLIEWAKEGVTQVELEDVFLEDIKKPVNIFNVMQLLVSKNVFPPAKKGRPKSNGN